MIYRLTIFVPTAMQNDLNEFFHDDVDPMGGNLTFTVEANATGDPDDPVTHYLCSGSYTELQMNDIANEFSVITGEPLVLPLTTFFANLTAHGIQSDLRDNAGAWVNNEDFFDNSSLFPLNQPVS